MNESRGHRAGQVRETITSVTNARVKQLVRWREKPRERQSAGVLLAEGVREVERAAAAGLVLREWYVCEALLGEAESDRLRVLLRGAVPWGVSESVLVKVSFHAKPEGVLAVFDVPVWTLESLKAPAGAALYLVAVDTEKPGNLGAMVRSASAAGADAVLAVGASVDAWNPQAIRNSTGAVFSLPVVHVNDASSAVSWLKSRGVLVVAAVSGAGELPERVAMTGPVAIVIGPEHAGLSASWSEWADASVTIPMPGGAAALAGGAVDSLNASVSAAVLLFETARQRRAASAAGGLGSCPAC